MNEVAPELLEEAKQYHLKASFILAELQANNEVYGSNSATTGAVPADIDLALQYIDRSLEICPENAVYLNMKALFLWEGKGDKELALILLQKAAEIAPRDIDIQNNLKTINETSKGTSPCFVATAAFGSPLAAEVGLLREWRDDFLLKSRLGRTFVAIYYIVSPPIARVVASHHLVRGLTRLILRPLIAVARLHNSKRRS